MNTSSNTIPNASIPPSEMPSNTNQAPKKNNTALIIIVTIVAIISILQILLPMGIVFLAASNFDGIFDDFYQEIQDLDSDAVGYAAYGGKWQIEDYDYCVTLNSDYSYVWQEDCLVSEDNVYHGNYTVKSGKEALEDLGMDLDDVDEIADAGGVIVNRVYSFVFTETSGIRDEGEVKPEELQSHKYLFYYINSKEAVMYDMDKKETYSLDYVVSEDKEDEKPELPIDATPQPTNRT